MSKVTVKLENSYSDGHTSTNEVVLNAPVGVDTLEDWWEEEVWEHTGDGHAVGRDLGSCCTATIIAADDPALVGQVNEWVD